MTRDRLATHTLSQNLQRRKKIKTQSLSGHLTLWTTWSQGKPNCFHRVNSWFKKLRSSTPNSGPVSSQHLWATRLVGDHSSRHPKTNPTRGVSWRHDIMAIMWEKRSTHLSRVPHNYCRAPAVVRPEESTWTHNSHLTSNRNPQWLSLDRSENVSLETVALSVKLSTGADHRTRTSFKSIKLTWADLQHTCSHQMSGSSTLNNNMCHSENWCDWQHILKTGVVDGTCEKVWHVQNAATNPRKEHLFVCGVTCSRYSVTVHVFDGWGGVGWGGGGLITFKYTSTHTSCYATARCSCTCTHTSCYATARCSCTCTHTHTRHATLLYVALALAHTRHATLLHAALALAHTHTHVMLRFSVRSVVHKKSEWTKKCKVKGKAKLAGTQVRDRSWMWLKKFVPHTLKNRYYKVINPRLWEYIYQFAYRHNQKD